METIFEITLYELNGRDGIAIATEFNDDKEIIIPKLMIGICAGMKAGDSDIKLLFEVLKSVV